MDKKDISVSAPLRFDHTAPTLARLTSQFSESWPTVYIINNDDEAYVGETTNALVRFSQHLDNPQRQRLHTVRLISGHTFNKSVALDLEAFLIAHISADGKFRLQNGNAGQQKHDYYQRSEYEEQFKKVWKELKALNLANNELHQIENSNLFKYSPYKSLTPDQYSIVSEIVKELANNFKTQSTFLINGGPGTGKTILGIYMLKLLSAPLEDDNDENDSEIYQRLWQVHSIAPNPKIGIVISMSNLRQIIKEVFKNTYGLSANMVYAPSEIAHAKGTFDLLVVDEAHRLRQRKALSQYGQYDDANKALGLSNESTELDWIMRKSRHQILLYDQDQTIKATDIDSQHFDNIRHNENTICYKLETQVRCHLGGQKYIDFIKDIFKPEPLTVKPTKFQNYDLHLFDDVNDMVSAIKEKNQQFGLCRTVAGYAWKWRTKNRLHPEPINEASTQQYINRGLYDIDIDGNKYIWNVKYDGWLSSPNSINEIGCIHTIQGFDLNYTGVIIGNELKYDQSTNQLYIDASAYYDRKGKTSASDADLLRYILHIYQVLCTRGMRGTYIYACDPGMRELLRMLIWH